MLFALDISGAPAFSEPTACEANSGDGKRVKSVLNGEITFFVGGHYSIPFGDEKTGSQVTKYYFAGSTRIAIRTYTMPESSTLTYLLGDHLGSTSLTTNASGVVEVVTLYKPCPYGMLRDPQGAARG